MKSLNKLLLPGAALLIASCGSPAIVSTPIENIDTVPLKVSEISEDQLKSWSHADLLTDTIPGMSVNKAYSEIIPALKGKATTVVVGVIDSGVDIEHEDLKNVIWTNDDEIPNNGIDDDNNGYVDDVHGWNFLGEATHEQLEFVRILKKGDKSHPDYERAQKEYDEKYNEAQQNKQFYEQLLQNLNNAEDAVKKHLNKDSYTKEDLDAIKTDDSSLLQYVAFLNQMYQVAESPENAREQLKEGIEYFAGQLNYHLNIDFNGRAVVGDNPDDINDTDYGNNDVIGDIEHATHGTHVAGIIAAQRNNGVGMNGVANNVEIMPIRAVPDGDEYDKDVALAIRYAVDNGAKIINTSFGKYYSPNAEWVYDAIKYAAEHDVLIVNAAGNEAYNLNERDVYPNDAVNNGPEIADNFLTVGALNFKYGTELIANFSNYGNIDVDVFAPGTKIWATVPNNEYQFLQGTSMAAPAVAGVAALIRSYFPKLTAAQVKQIIMASGLSSKAKVQLGGNPSNLKNFVDISKSGKMVNAYNALILADKVSRGKISL